MEFAQAGANFGADPHQARSHSFPQEQQSLIRAQAQTSRRVKVTRDKEAGPIIAGSVPPRGGFGLEHVSEDGFEPASVDPREREDEIGDPADGLGHVSRSLGTDDHALRRGASLWAVRSASNSPRLRVEREQMHIDRGIL